MSHDQKKSGEKSDAWLRIFDLLSGTFSNFPTVCRRDLGPSPLILGDIWYI